MEPEPPKAFLKINRGSLPKLPESPGVYFFWQRDTPIYIGKAINLRSRLASYLATGLLPKTQKMVTEADKISYIRVNSEFEAILLEAYLINKLQPFYNIISKDDKHPLYIRITKENYPRVLTARKINEAENNLAFHGPFPSSVAVKSTLRMLRKIFPFSDHKIGKKPCLYSHLGLCTPCPNVIENTHNLVLKARLKQKFQNNIRFLRLVLDRKLSTVKFILDKKMRQLALQQDFESAASVRDQLQRLEYITQPRMNFQEFLQNPNLLADTYSQEMLELNNYLSQFFSLPKPISRIECYDVAHLGGAFPTASMVTFINSEADKSFYRHFAIRQKRGQDDLASLAEVVQRRIKHLKLWGQPDLIIVDGGKGQAAIFYQILSPLKIPIVGIAKRNETLVVPQPVGEKIKFVELRLPAGPILNLLQRLRNEAHRFAQRYHHRLIRKNLLTG